MSEIKSSILRRRTAGPVPYGWKICEANPKYIEPIPEEMELVEKAREYVKSGEYSHEAVRKWLIESVEKPISVRGFELLMKRDF